MPTLSRQGRLVVIAVGLAQICLTLDYFSLTVALPDMARDLDVSTSDLQWALSGYLLSFSALLVAGGRVGDIFGRRRVLVTGIAIFGLSSLVCGLASSAEMLVVFRVVQGVGGAIVFPVSLAVLANAFDGEARAHAIGLVVFVATLGNAIGPFVGGVLTDLLDWRWVLLINAPIAAAAIALVLRAVGESRDETASRRLDWPGMVTLSAGIVGVALLIDRGPEWGAGSAAFIVTAVGAVALLVAFWVIEHRVASPLVDPAVLHSRPFVLVTAGGALSNFCWALLAFIATLYLQDVRGLSPLEAGFAFLALSAGTALGGPLSGRLVKHAAVPPLMIGASLIAAIGLGGLAGVEAWGAWLPLFFVCGVGVGLNYALCNQGVLGTVPARLAGAGSGVMLTALIMMAALATAAGATAVEELASGPGAAALGNAIDTVLRAGAIIALASALPLIPLIRRGRAAQVESEPAAAS
jgi:EmrB/QacA subfamily drug resistance transporter